MVRTLLTGSLIVLALSAWTSPASAQDSKMVRGSITAISADSLSVSAEGHEMKFGVDRNTSVVAAGAGRKTSAAQAAGKSGARLDTLLRPGQAVEVSYRESGGTMHATRIRTVTSVSAADPNAAETASGKVTAVSPTSLTIAGSKGPATFTQTFAIDSSTKVVGKGAGTLANSKGGKIQITDYVTKGDSVSVSYRKSGASLVASEVHVTK